MLIYICLCSLLIVWCGAISLLEANFLLREARKDARRPHPIKEDIEDSPQVIVNSEGRVFNVPHRRMAPESPLEALSPSHRIRQRLVRSLLFSKKPAGNGISKNIRDTVYNRQHIYEFFG